MYACSTFFLSLLPSKLENERSKEEEKEGKKATTPRNYNKTVVRAVHESKNPNNGL